MEKTNKPITMIIAITGHLDKCQHTKSTTEGEGLCTYLQYVACMQLSQLENASLISDICPWASETTPLPPIPACKLRATMSSTPPLTLLAIARSIEGISALAQQPKCEIRAHTCRNEG